MENGSGSGGSTSSDSLSAAGTATHNWACAAYKFQRRRCMPDYVLAPFFLATAQQRFLKAHRLFGIRNMYMMVKVLYLKKRTEVLKTIIYKSEVCAIDPIGGCYNLILDFESQLQQHLTELDFINEKLIACCEQAQAMPAANMPPVITAPPPPVPNSTYSDLTPFGTTSEDANNLNVVRWGCFPRN
ncbi:LOB domain-containing protein 22-like [Canna indica]|uniref:LOB domain-containing protein 22-like n=1 Tax=Canna indica TaxID=4628 RepID=A0AAQ3KZZ5_9LILI|nr:LOB domain-containing protein 22-like [Canna indica]